MLFMEGANLMPNNSIGEVMTDDFVDVWGSEPALQFEHHYASSSMVSSAAEFASADARSDSELSSFLFDVFAPSGTTAEYPNTTNNSLAAGPEAAAGDFFYPAPTTVVAQEPVPGPAAPSSFTPVGGSMRRFDSSGSIESSVSGRSNGSAGSGSSCTASSLNKKIYYRRSWTPQEDARLLQLVQQYGAAHWSRIASYMPGKTGNQCSQRWHKALDPTIIKGKWSDAEDKLLVEMVGKIGKKWKMISKHIPGRTGKQCRDRYTARLNPNLKLGKWTAEEERIAVEAHAKLGNRWAAIQKLLPHRSWYTIKWKIESLAKQERKAQEEQKLQQQQQQQQ